VKLVYASTLNPDALAYRRRRGLAGSDEQMAILVQRVSGAPFGRLFFPSLAGVAASRNLYAWNDRIDRGRGMVRLVFGLGTRAVNRVGGDYPRMIALSHPDLRPEVGSKVAKYSQHEVDVIDLERNDCATLSSVDVFSREEYPSVHLLISELAEGYVDDPATRLLRRPPDHWVLTFNNLLRRTPFVAVMDEMLRKLEEAYGRPVDTEFTASIGP